ncbi:sugar nucleotide-binding protein [Nisaea acidiphila]|uniref:Sugar nucleotide-binding protein n=1 Tax=Nisaea acidiphila TaxID=1862145 RepID=A0A9J7AP34_9PROT|nr:sugar nucleotide-binding protein [Nisaea acidiphila]UUX48353.1 sugar nucleotide-binding protein [Nisaea acidiphila]
MKAARWDVAGTSRSPRASDNADLVTFDGTSPIEPAIFRGVTHIIASIPPGEAGDPALVRHAADLRMLPDLRWVGYLSTPAVYGDRGGALVSEEDAPRPGSERGRRRLAAERAWVEAFEGTAVSVQVFRLSGIYGPGRSALDQLRAGTARIIDKPGQVFNRIHVDDIGTILMASMERPHHGRVYNVADDEACPSGDVIRYAAELLGVQPPAPISYDSAELSPMARSFYAECKRLDTTRIKTELGVELAYPTYREGLRRILDDLESAA